jgi:uncharacterized Rossmann fold enzyme
MFSHPGPTGPEANSMKGLDSRARPPSTSLSLNRTHAWQTVLNFEEEGAMNISPAQPSMRQPSLLRPALPLKVHARLYREVSARLRWDHEMDRAAARMLGRMLKGCSRPSLVESELHGRPCIVLGAGPSLVRDVEAIRTYGLDRACSIVAADGAACALLEAGLVPSVVVSDLDGREECLVKARELGSLFVVHAHGDNLELLERLVPLLRPVLGTCQVEGPRPLANLGGIMDGDRAVCLAVSACANPVILGGMDLEGGIGEYSSMGRRPPEEAGYRLLTTKTVLGEVARVSKKVFLNATSGGSTISGFTRVSWKQVWEKLLGGR